jgi:type III pantothenate kinase
MLLALDIGNSAVKAALFDGDTLVDAHALASPSDAEAPPVAHWREALAPWAGHASLERIGLVSVVPARTEALATALRSLTDAPLVRVTPALDLPFDIAYETPETLGHDRLAAAAAGWMRHGRDGPRSVLVVDAGTALNYEVVHRNGVYRGGAISAGPALVQEALAAGTAQLPPVPLSPPATPVGRATETALRSGIVWGLVDQVRGMCRRFADALPDRPRIVLTGGWGGLLAEHLSTARHAPHLVLHGTRLLAAPPTPPSSPHD